MNPGLWGALSALCWGSADFAARFTGQAIGYPIALLGVLAVGTAVLTGLAFFAPALQHWDWNHAWLLVVTGVAIMAATLLLYNGLARGPVTVVAPVVGSYPALIVLVAVVMGSRPSLSHWVAMGVVFAGVILVARGADAFVSEGALSRRELTGTVGIAVVAAFAFAIGVATGQVAVKFYGEFYTTWLSRAVSFVCLVLLCVVQRRRITLPCKWLSWVALQGLLDTSGYLALFAGSRAENAQIAVVAASAFGIVTVLLARFFLRETMTCQQWGGVLLVFAGVAVLAGTGG